MSSSTDAAERPFEPVRFASREGGSVAGAAPSGKVPWDELAFHVPVTENGSAPEAASDPDEPVDRPEEGSGRILFGEEELARICAAVAWQARGAEREAARRREAEARTAALRRFEARLEALAASGDRAWEELQARLAEVVYLLAAAAVPALVARLEKQEVEKAVGDLLVRLGPEEELRIHVHPGLAEDLRQRLAVDSGVTAGGIRWEVVAEKGMAPGDFRIERSHGFIERRAEEICSRILAAVEAVLAGGHGGREGVGEADGGLHSAREQSP